MHNNKLNKHVVFSDIVYDAASYSMYLSAYFCVSKQLLSK